MKRIVRKALFWMLATSLILATHSIAAGKGSTGSTGSLEEDHGNQKDSEDQGLLLGLIYGDQWIVVRDLTATGNGKPVYFSWEWPAEAYTEDGDFDPPPNVYPTGYLEGLESGCVQPISFDPVEPLDAQFEVADSDVLFYDSYGRERVPAYLIPLDPECKIPDAYAGSWGEQVMEANSGRLNLARSPQHVIDAAYEEALATMNEARSFSLDPAGRLALELETTDEYGNLDSVLKTIDSPLENLALYQRIMQSGCLADTANIALSEESASLLTSSGLGHLNCSNNTSPTSQDFLRAASFLGGAADKTGRISVDMLIYLNNRLGVNDVVWSADGKEVSIGYYNFQGASYNRKENHFNTTAGLLQPPDNADTSTFPSFFNVVNNTTIYDKVFSADWPGGEENGVMMNSPVINFVRAADDALGIINYIHSYALPTFPLPPVEEPTYPAD